MRSVMSRCPAGGRRRERRVAFADGATDEAMPSPRRARDQPVDEVVAELSAATADTAPCAEATGEKTATTPSRAAYGNRGPAFLSYHLNVLCTRSPTPQVLQRWKVPETQSRRAPRCTT